MTRYRSAPGGCLKGVLFRNRSRALLRVAALCVSCVLAWPRPSAGGASVTIGQLAPGRPRPNCTTSGLDYLEPSVTGGNLYVAKEAGTITSWIDELVRRGGDLRASRSFAARPIPTPSRSWPTRLRTW